MKSLERAAGRVVRGLERVGKRTASLGRLTAGVALLASLSCGTNPPPGPGASTGPAPNLEGATVMLLPAQAVEDLPGSPDADIRFALTGRGENVRWILPAEIEEVLRRSPGAGVDIHNLATEVFLHVEVHRIGDPLYGDLRRLAALTNAQVALIPVRVRHHTVEDLPGAVEIAAALVHIDSGIPLWYGVVEGAPGAAEDPRSLATAADALAGVLLR